MFLSTALLIESAAVVVVRGHGVGGGWLNGSKVLAVQQSAKVSQLDAIDGFVLTIDLSQLSRRAIGHGARIDSM